jgi:hypothetical protein
MSESKGGSVWGRWIPHPGNLLTAPEGGAFGGAMGVLVGAPSVVLGCGHLFAVARTPALGAAALQGFCGALATAFGLVVLVASEGAFARSSAAARWRSRPLALVGARLAALLTVLVGFWLLLAALGAHPGGFFFARGNAIFAPGSLDRDAAGAFSAVDWSQTSGHSHSMNGGFVASLWLALPALLAAYLLARPVARLSSLPPRRAVVAWAGTTAALVAIAAVAWGLSLAGLRSLPGADALWRGILWALLGSGLAASMALAAQRRLALWDHADRWRDATLTADLRLVFTDGSGTRPASPQFNGYVGPVVVLPTAESAGSVFRGDGAPADGWVVAGTKAALLESVQCAHATARITVAAVAVMATAPLAAWLVSSVL